MEDGRTVKWWMAQSYYGSTFVLQRLLWSSKNLQTCFRYEAKLLSGSRSHSPRGIVTFGSIQVRIKGK